jgi:glycosyltransferase involved in cell wall biosynthesis
VLPPLLHAVKRVVLVDNGSTDGTVAVARRVAADAGAADRLELRSYPFAISRCGAEHLETAPDSVHSLAYFYNWAFSHVRTTYALKWDGDMVLTDAAVAALRDLEWQLEGTEAIVRVPRHPLYVAGDRQAFLDGAVINREPWAWPNGPGYSFVKAIDWELPLWSPDMPAITLGDWACVELKHLNADEFGHWSHNGFDASARTQRKRREWETFHAIAAGGALPDGVVPIEAPNGRHVVEYVRQIWLPERAAQPLAA